jgi:hypothetical protein
MRFGRFALAGLLLIFGLPELGRADIVISAAGDTNPTTENFGLWPFNGGIATAALPNDLGVAAWQIKSEGSSDEQAVYNQLGGTGPFDAGGSGLTQQETNEINAQGFVMSLDARVVSGPIFDPSGSGLFSIVSTLTGISGRRFDIDLGLNASGNTVVDLANTVSFNGGSFFSSTPFGSPVTISGNGYHLYQLSYDPLTATATLFVDGVEEISGYAGAAVSGGAVANNYGLAFGSVDDATGNFARVELDLGQFSPTSVPEPGTLSLLGFTALAIVCFRVGSEIFAWHKSREDAPEPRG